MRVCYFGAYDKNYPRNQVLRAGLAANGAEVIECRVPKRWRTVHRIPALIGQYLRVWRQCDVILLAEFGQSLAPIAWMLSRITGRPLITDLLVSFYELAVDVRRVADSNSLQARRYFWLDKTAARLCDAAITDAPPHKQHFVEAFGAEAEKLYVIPLGVNDSHFAAPAPSEEDRSASQVLTLQYYGSYTPAHGVETIIRAASRLRARSDIGFRFLGDGQERAKVEALACELELSSVRFDPPVPYADLPKQIVAADICLGEFGDTPQTKRGLANKVFQALAMGKALINGDTPSIRSLFKPGEHLEVCPLADPDSLAETIIALADDPSRRSQIGHAGQKWTLEHYTPRPLAKRLLEIIEGATQ